jgi:hypothetical protein
LCEIRKDDESSFPLTILLPSSAKFYELELAGEENKNKWEKETKQG